MLGLVTRKHLNRFLCKKHEILLQLLLFNSILNIKRFMKMKIETLSDIVIESFSLRLCIFANVCRVKVEENLHL